MPSCSPKDTLTSAVIGTLFTIFNIYLAIAKVVLLLFFPITKYCVDRRLKTWFDIEINGNRPHDIKAYDEKKVYIRLALEGHLGLGECALDGDVSMDNYYKVAETVTMSRNANKIEHPLSYLLKKLNLQTKGRAWQVGKQHYDDAHEVIMSMIDKNLQYTCGYWKNALNLEDAQLAKMELIAQKLNLQPGMKVLDIGCGYGTLASYLAKNYGVSVVGNTISKEQIKYAEYLCQGLPCQFRLCDYRDIDEKFDRIVSVGMFEHVGPKNYNTFFDVCRKCLADNGLLLLHTIGMAHKNTPVCDIYINKYIFPNGQIPYYLEICRAIEGNWIIEDWHNFGFEYSKTLQAWEDNFVQAWPNLKGKFDERFYRMWIMYLQMARALFYTRSFQLWQVVLSKDGLQGGYHSSR